MSVAINKVMIAGGLTRDPELRNLRADKSVVSFSIAINRKYRAADGTPKEEVTFVDVEAWGRTAELVAQHLAKGSSCFVEGRLRLDSWEDKSGAKRSRMKVLADNVQFLGKWTPSDQPAKKAKEMPVEPPPAAEESDEVPF
jgi:single-strand DNA-binding protein